MTCIGNNAFSDCRNLTSITIPESVTSIGYQAFGNCTGLTSVNITDIAAWCNIDFGSNYANPLYCAKALYLNDELITDLVIPDGVTSINDYAFYNCSGLTNITIPDGVTRIGDGTFYNCSGLTSITIPDSVTRIGYEAFYYCKSISDVYYTGMENEWNNISVSSGNTYLTKATRTYITETKKGTQTTVSGKTFTVTPINITSGNTVIIALYNGEKLVDTQSKIYAGESLTFETEEDYTSAKVFVWENVNNIAPVCEPERVK